MYVGQFEVTSLIVSNETCASQCPQACDEASYITQVTANKWPRNGSTEYGNYMSEMPNLVPPDLDQHLVNLNVYFQVCYDYIYIELFRI